MSFQALPGFRDFYPDDLAFRAHLFDAFRAVARRYGFEEYDGPPLESLELYTAKSGEEIVGQLYAFTDRGDRAVALRPEMTPTLARMVAARANGLRKPIRWFSIPQLFRYERQQRGRLREHFQLNCDLLGEPGPAADAEIMALALDIMRALGLGPGDVRLRVSDRRLLAAVLEAIGVPEEARPSAWQLLDKAGRREAESCRQALLAAGGTAEHGAAMAGLGSIRSWPELLGRYPGVEIAGAPLREAVQRLDAMGLGEYVDLDLTIVRGLAYYTGPVFELFDAGRSLRAICGGGRYDDLLAAVGGPPMPAVGFGMGDVVLGELLRDRGLQAAPVAPVDLLVAAAGDEDRTAALALAHRLRDAGWRVEYALGPAHLGKQFRLADARGARAVLVAGADERARGTVTCRDLRAAAQEELPLDGLERRLAERFGSPPAARILPTVQRPPTHG